jgi:hypothetical protein
MAVAVVVAVAVKAEEMAAVETEMAATTGKKIRRHRLQIRRSRAMI